MKEEDVDLHRMIVEHDRQIPRQQAIVRPGRKGITLSIHPYEDVKVYDIDIEDNIVDMITLTFHAPAIFFA